MPRASDGTFYYTPNTEAVKDDIARSAHYNQRFEDVAVDLNQVRTIQTGGTGATSAENARKNLKAAPADIENPDRAADAAKLGGVAADKYLSREKAQGLNVIGAYAWLSCTEQVAFGNIKSASTLRIAGMTSSGGLHRGTAFLDGTWKALGSCPANGATLFTKLTN